MKENSKPRHFASDNYAGICPEAFAALAQANTGHEVSYGDDAWTAKASDLIRDVFETKCEVFLVFNGTSANSLSLASLCQPYHSILCHEIAHVEVSECGAPEFFANGTKVLLLPGANGKIEPAAIERAVTRRTDIHYPKPRGLTLTQATEVGTVYTPDELKALWGVARKFDLRVHMDGARFANAVASLGVAPKEITWQAGVDVLSFGGTKNGIGVGEAVVFFNVELAREFDYRCKQGGQLASKMRFLSAPWVGLLRTARGCVTRSTPTRWRSASTRRSADCRACGSRSRWRPTPCSPRFPTTSCRPCTNAAGSFTRTSASTMRA
jgi:threonine aldolase